MRADLIIENAVIRTMDAAGKKAQAVAVKNGRIIDIGSDMQVIQLVGPQTKRIDLQGKTVLPGFIDAHEHFSFFGESLLMVDLTYPGSKSIEDMKSKLNAAAKKLPKGEWIRGLGYDDTKMAEGRMLTREDLDEAAPDHPVIIIHESFHSGFVNSAAYQAGGIDEGTPDPESGCYEKDPATGRLTGQLVESAFFNFAFEAFSDGPTVVPSFDKAQRESFLVEAARNLNESGVTSVHDALVSSSYVTSYVELAKRNALPLRVNMLLSFTLLPELEALGLSGDWGNEWVRSTGVKGFIDGAFVERTAYLKEPYLHDPNDCGLLVVEDEKEFQDMVKRIHSLGYQVCLHANGDSAIEMALDAMEKAQREDPRNDPRHRIEHCTVIDDGILKRMRSLGCIAVPFGSYVLQHGEKIAPYYGEHRAGRLFAFKSFLDAGVPVAASSDHPSGWKEPLLGVQSMVTRKTATGEVVGAEQRISVEEAFKMYTAYAAYASFEEKIKGTLEPGKLADMVVLDRDPWAVDPDTIGEIPISMTIVDGKVVYERP